MSQVSPPVILPGAAAPDEPKVVEPGYRTTEFWKSLAVTFVGLGVLAYGVYTKQIEVAILGGGMAGVTMGTYNLSRGLAKA